MFIHSFRLKNILFGTIVFLLTVAISLNVFSAVMTVRTSAEPIDAAPPSKESTNKVVYLTFDDGPSVVTADILDLLKEENIPATFFVIGATTDRGKMLYQRMVDEGHSIGLHSYSHKYNEIYANADAYLADFERLQKHLQEIVGDTPKIFRFPGGSNNSNASASTLERVKEITAEQGYVFFDWNALAKDDKATPTPAEKMFKNIIKSGKDEDRILILMHDDALRTTAVDCIKMLIDYYTEKGYHIEALTEETPPIQFKPRKY